MIDQVGCLLSIILWTDGNLLSQLMFLTAGYSSPCAEKSPLSKVYTYPFFSIVDPFVSFLTHLFLDLFPFVFFVTHFQLFELESFSRDMNLH
jgi:hypothetical protein